MTLEDVELDAVPLEPHRLKQEGYLEAMLQCLCAKHKKRLQITKEEPIFYLEVGSRMNRDDFSLTQVS